MANPSFGTPFNHILYAFLQFHCVFIKAVRKDLPVFEPNAYFWSHHWKEGKEEKWEAFASAVREIIAEHSADPMSPLDPATGLGSKRQVLVDSTMEDKLEYKKEMREIMSKKES